MPLRFTLRQLEYLVAVGEAGSIALAAERVNVSSPSISAAIAQLEQEFGLQLFLRRHAQGLGLTQGDRQFVAEARAVLAAAARLGDLANDITGKVRGRLSIGCLVTFAQMVLPRVRRSFCDLHPDVEFQQYELDQAEIFAGLRAARLDAALTYDLDIPSDLSFVPLLALAPHVVLHPGHPLARRAWITPADLGVADGAARSAVFHRLFSRSVPPHRVAPEGGGTHPRSGGMRSMVANGFGYSIANIRPATVTAPDGRPLHFVPLRGPAPLALGLVLAEGARAALTIRAFLEHCQAGITEATLPGLVIGGA